MVTRFLQDILRQPTELQLTIDYLRGAGQRRLAEAAAIIENARHVYVTGIGSSWHAALTAGPLFSLGGFPVYFQEASEVVQFSPNPSGAGIICISRRGRRIEICPPLAKAHWRRAIGVGVSNFDGG